MLLLVALVEGELGLAREDVHLGAHGVRVACEAGVLPLPPRLAPGSRLCLDQPLLNQTVSRCLKDVQSVRLDAALEKATFLFTVFGKLGLFLEDKSLNKLQILCDRYLHILHT